MHLATKVSAGRHRSVEKQRQCQRLRQAAELGSVGDSPLADFDYIRIAIAGTSNILDLSQQIG